MDQLEERILQTDQLKNASKRLRDFDYSRWPYPKTGLYPTGRIVFNTVLYCMVGIRLLYTIKFSEYLHLMGI